MNVTDSFLARMRAIATAAGYTVKPLSEQHIAKRLLAELEADASPGAIRHELRKIREELPRHFWTADDKLAFANKKAAERLEFANARTAEQRAEAERIRKAALPKITLTERELKLPPELRLAIIEERKAAAIEEQKAAALAELANKKLKGK